MSGFGLEDNPQASQSMGFITLRTPRSNVVMRRIPLPEELVGHPDGGQRLKGGEEVDHYPLAPLHACQIRCCSGATVRFKWTL